MNDYSEAERAIFQFDHGDGTRVSADPYAIDRELTRNLKGKPLGGEGGLMDAIERGDMTVASEAAAVLYPAIQATFGVKPLQADGSGMTEKMQYRLLLHWLRWKEDLKKKLATSPIG